MLFPADHSAAHACDHVACTMRFIEGKARSDCMFGRAQRIPHFWSVSNVQAGSLSPQSSVVTMSGMIVHAAQSAARISG